MIKNVTDKTMQCIVGRNGVRKLVMKPFMSVTGFIIKVDQDDHTDWFTKASVSDEEVFDGVSIYKDKTNSVGVVFKSGKKFVLLQMTTFWTLSLSYT